MHSVWRWTVNIAFGDVQHSRGIGSNHHFNLASKCTFSLENDVFLSGKTRVITGGECVLFFFKKIPKTPRYLWRWYGPWDPLGEMAASAKIGASQLIDGYMGGGEKTEAEFDWPRSRLAETQGS